MRSPVPGPCSNVDAASFFVELWREERWGKVTDNPRKELYDAAWGGEVQLLKGLLARGVPATYRDQARRPAGPPFPLRPPSQPPARPSWGACRARTPRASSAPLSHSPPTRPAARGPTEPPSAVGLDRPPPRLVHGPPRVRAPAPLPRRRDRRKEQRRPLPAPLGQPERPRQGRRGAPRRGRPLAALPTGAGLTLPIIPPAAAAADGTPPRPSLRPQTPGRTPTPGEMCAPLSPSPPPADPPAAQAVPPARFLDTPAVTGAAPSPRTPVRPQSHRTPLHMAAKDGDLECLRALLLAGADCDAQARSGRTYIERCCCAECSVPPPPPLLWRRTRIE